MKKGLVVLVLIAVLLGGCNRGSDGLVTIELWYGAAVTEAGPPPADWVALEIIREKLGINLMLSALPSSEVDQDVRINAAAAGGMLPDLFMVRREPFVNIVRVGMAAPVDELYDLMPNRSALHYDENSRRFTTINGRSFGLASPF